VSGIVGILNLDGAPVDHELLSALTSFMTFRGPDAQQIWLDGSVGFGHALLKTTEESEPETQPFSVDKKVWIVADARVDAQLELIAELEANGQQVSRGAADAELILRAYQVWEEKCVEHLLGDFVFAIWDGPKRRLFCARDHFGVKPFYYAHIGSCLIFSNTLNCIRQHPSVSARLNDLAIADFLLFESIQDPQATSFADIARLEPAHTLEVKDGRVFTHRYWTLPVSAPFQSKRPMECVERFRELMDIAVADRVRNGPVGVLMSGGLDSSTVAASACRVFSRAGLPSRFRAYTQVYDSLIPYGERKYAGLVADALKIPIEYQVADGYKLFEGADLSENNGPEPMQLEWIAPQMDHLREQSRQNRVLLSGLGADPVFSCRLTVYFRQLLKQGQIGRALGEAFRFLSAENRWSRLYLRTRWRLLFGTYTRSVRYPGWLNPELEGRYQLRQRFEQLNFKVPVSQGVRPVAYGNMTSGFWPDIFSSLDAGVTNCAVEIYHPFFDVRLVGFLLCLPALPWCSDKELLREAGRGVLPDAVRLRRKTPMLADPVLVLLREPGSDWIDRFEAGPGLERYVIRDRIPPACTAGDSFSAYINLRPLSLNYWLQRVGR
jgi:asparagine synthase (glutamine-hydrolysing)